MNTGLFSDSFFSRLARNEMTLERFLNDEGSFVQIRRQNKVVTNYLIDNIKKLLEYALQEDSSFLSQRANKVLEQNNIKLLNSISEGSDIHDIANEIIANEEKQISSILGKFGAILDLCFKKNPDCISNFTFLPDFLQFSDNLMIESLFDTIFSINKEDVKYFIQTNEFPDLIIDLITKWHKGESKNRQCAISLYKILLKLISTNREYFVTPQLISFSMDFFGENNDYGILSKQWKLASEVLDTSNVKDFSTLYPLALQAIEVSNNPDVFLEYQVNAIEFVSNLLNYMPSFAAQIDGKALISSITNVFSIFKESSIALSMACSFMVSVFEGMELRSYIIDIFFPEVVKACRTENRVNQRAFALEFGRQVLEIGFDDEDILTEMKKHPDFMEVCVPKIRVAEEIMAKENCDFCVCPNFVRCNSFDTLKPVSINLNLSV